MYVIQNREPELALHYFEDISAIPRGSYQEEAVARFIAQRAKELGLYVRVDARHNVVVKKPASKGCEELPPVLLQAHLDMVCEKNQDTVHDFEKDGLKLVVDGNILRAEGTTLGADDGKGVAYMMALMDADSDGFAHPPLEFLFTTGEEVGFWGALALDPSDIEARRMIGLDAGPEGAVATTSAGAQEVNLRIPAETMPLEGSYLNGALAIRVRGMLGGHSAGCITLERGNANKIMGRLLHRVQQGADFAICQIRGGLMFNAIPREADAVIALNTGSLQYTMDQLAKEAAAIQEELSVSDPGVSIEMTVIPREERPVQMLTLEATQTVADCLYHVPNGVWRMSREIPGFPVTSTNMGVVKLEDGVVTINTMMRSASRTAKEDLLEHICSVAALCGVTCMEKGPWLAAWEYRADSKMRALAKQLYQEQTGKEMAEHGTHGGLELGVFSEKMPGMDIVTLGCDSGNEHTVTEWMDLDSFDRVYRFLKDFLAALTRE